MGSFDLVENSIFSNDHPFVAEIKWDLKLSVPEFLDKPKPAPAKSRRNGRGGKTSSCPPKDQSTIPFPSKESNVFRVELEFNSCPLI